MRRSVVFLLVALVVPAVTLASPQPSPACDACGTPFETAAADLGTSADVTHSQATIRLDEDGVATWTVRNRVDNSTVRAFRERPARVTAVARNVFATYPFGHVENPTNVSAELENDTVVVTYSDPDAATRTLGVLVFESFDDDGYDRPLVRNADRLTLVGPNGTRVTNDPTGATVEERRVAWGGGDPASSSGDYPEGAAMEPTRVTFAAEDTSYADARTGAALALDTAPIYLSNLESYALPAVVVFALLFGGVAAATRRFATRERAHGVAVTLPVLGVGALVAAFGGPFVGETLPPWLVGAGAASAAVGTVAEWRRSWLTAPGGAAAVGGFAVALAAILGAAFAFVSGRPLASTVGEALWSVPLAVMPLAGALARSDDRSRPWGYAVGVVGFAVGAALVVPVDSRPFGLVIVVPLAFAVIVAAASVPLFVVGYAAGPLRSP